jgi:hypothetical protein
VAVAVEFLGLVCVADGHSCVARCEDNCATLDPLNNSTSVSRVLVSPSFLARSEWLTCVRSRCASPKRVCQDGETQDVSLEQIRLGPSEPSKATFTKKQQVEARDKDTWFVPLIFASLLSSPDIFLLSFWRREALPPLGLYRSPRLMFALGACHRTRPFSAQSSGCCHS